MNRCTTENCTGPWGHDGGCIVIKNTYLLTDYPSREAQWLAAFPRR